MIRYGPAGWMYADWAGVVYPDPKPKKFDPLRYLAGYFDTVEVNSTFYGPPTAKTVHGWLRRVEDRPGFRFTAKLYRRFTHQRTTAFTKEEVDEVRAGFDPLLESGRLGAVLLQFPWSFRRTDENRECLDDVTRTFGHYPLVLEVRHATWNTPGLLQTLGERGIGFVNIDQPLFGDSIAPSAHATAPVGYVRVHGRNYRDWFREKAGRDERYDYLYSARELEPWAERTKEIAADAATEDVFVITNNHFLGQAVVNALMLRSMVEGEKVPPRRRSWPRTAKRWQATPSPATDVARRPGGPFLWRHKPSCNRGLTPLTNSLVCRTGPRYRGSPPAVSVPRSPFLWASFPPSSWWTRTRTAA